MQRLEPPGIVGCGYTYLDGDDDNRDAFQAGLVEELPRCLGGNGWHHLRQGLLHCTQAQDVT